MSLYEAAALGASMSLPYGSWMGSVIEDSFSAPHALCVEIGTFLADHEQLFSQKTLAEVGVIYSVESNFQLVAQRDQFADNRANKSGSGTIPFWDVCDALADAVQPFDVLFFPDGDLRADSLTRDDLHQYWTLILPDCRFLTAEQARLLRAFLEQGGHLLVLGGLGTNLAEGERQALLNHANTVRKEGGFHMNLLPGGEQVTFDMTRNLTINVQRTADGTAIHLIRYDYDEAQDAVSALAEMALHLRLPERFQTIEVIAPNGAPEAALRHSEGSGLHHITVRNMPLYTIIMLKRA